MSFLKIQKIDRPIFWALFFLAAILLLNALLLWHGSSPNKPPVEVHQESTALLGISSDGWVAVFTFILAVSTIGLWLSTRLAVVHARTDSERQAREMQASLATAEAANKIAADAAKVAQKAFQETIVSTDRAWIKIDAEITGALVFTADTISTKAKITYTNVGKSPATHVQSLGYAMFANVVDAAETAHNSIRSGFLFTSFGGRYGEGRTLFPGEDFVEDVAYQMPTDHFKARIEATETASEPWTFGNPAILASVRYVLAGDTRSRYTIVPFAIADHDPKHVGFDGNEAKIDLETLTLRQIYVSGRLS